MKVIIAFFFIIAIACFTSCSGYKDAVASDSNIKNLELGMTKKEAVNIMGKSYKLIATANEDGIKNEVIGYETPETNWMYMLYFSNGILDRYQREWVGNPYPVPPPAENK